MLNWNAVTKYRKIIWFLLLGIFFCLNYWSRKKLPQSYGYHLSYDQLYLNYSSLYIKLVIADYPSRNLKMEIGASFNFLGDLVILDHQGQPVPR
jgi:hypothetical protein